MFLFNRVNLIRINSLYTLTETEEKCYYIILIESSIFSTEALSAGEIDHVGLYDAQGPVTEGYDRGNGCADNKISRIHRRFHRLQYGTTLQPTIKGYSSGDERQLYKQRTIRTHQTPRKGSIYTT